MLQQFLLHSFQNETDCHFVLLKHAPTCALFLLPTSALTIAEYVTSWRRATITSPRKGSWVFGEDRVSSCILGEDHVADNWPLTSSANTHQPCYTGLCLQKLIFLTVYKSWSSCLYLQKLLSWYGHWPLLTKAGHVSYGLRFTWREGPWGFLGLWGEGPRGVPAVSIHSGLQTDLMKLDPGQGTV